MVKLFMEEEPITPEEKVSTPGEEEGKGEETPAEEKPEVQTMEKSRPLSRSLLTGFYFGGLDKGLWYDKID